MPTVLSRFLFILVASIREWMRYSLFLLEQRHHSHGPAKQEDRKDVCCLRTPAAEISADRKAGAKVEIAHDKVSTEVFTEK
jgi:hypothetical protein